MADSKLSALSEVSVPELEDYLYFVEDPTGTPTSRRTSAGRFLGLLPNVCDGRLTTETGVPVSTGDRTTQGTLYFTPYKGNRVSLYDGTRWRLYSFTERSLALSGLNSGRPYDAFLYDNAGTLALEFTSWTNDTTRATALTTQDGVLVKTGATTRRYLGTFYTTSATATEDSATNRYVWNYYHRVRKPLAVREGTGHTYTTASWREWRATTTRCRAVVGVLEDAWNFTGTGEQAHTDPPTTAYMGWGKNSTTVTMSVGGAADSFFVINNNLQRAFVSITTSVFPDLGHNYFSCMEFGSSSATFESTTLNVEALC